MATNHEGIHKILFGLPDRRMEINLNVLIFTIGS